MAADPSLTGRLETQILGDTPLAFESPESSLVLAASYNKDTRMLSIQLRAGTVSKWYDYGGYPPSEWVDFYQSQSKGAFFSKRIRPLFGGKARAL